MLSKHWLVVIGVSAFFFGCASPSSQQQSAERQRQYAARDRIAQLESELRELRGQLEQIQYRQTSATNQGGGATAIEQRVATIERRLNIAPVGLSGGGFADFPSNDDPLSSSASRDRNLAVIGSGELPATAPGAPSVDSEERRAFNLALDTLRSGQYNDAVGDFDAFLTTYPNSQLAGDSTYWLGEAHYTNRDFEPAKRAYLTLGARYPASPKLPDALLKLGYIYSQLGEPERGQEMLKKLVEAFPDSSAATQARVRLNAG